ncbi:MAG: hypothetical protein V4657_01225 [Pseudomonadota bacterium]
MIFGPLAPDKATSGNPDILTVASGVYPMEDGYRPVGQFEGLYGDLNAAPKGGATFTSPEGLSYIIAGTATSLLKAFAGAWETIGTGYSLLAENRWRFAQYGGLAIATNGTDPMVKIDLASGVVSALGGTPPKFETLAVVKDFLVGGVRNGKVMHMGWSGINDAEWWTTGQRQADRQVLPAGGRINGILSGEYGVILQRDRICRMDYVGGSTIFSINEVSSNIGCVSVHSVAQWGTLGFFLSDEGFMMWDGQQPVPIGREFIDREFGEQYGVEDWSQMSTAVDPVNGIVMWSMADKVWLYSWIFQRWATLPIASSIIFSGVTKALSIDEQDLDVGVLDDDIDGAGLDPLDDTRFKGGAPLLYVFNSSDVLGTFSGTPMAATFTGTDLELFRGRRACLRFARPDCDATTGMTLSFLARQRLGDAGSTVTASSLVTSGDMPCRVNGRFLRPTLAIAAGTTWEYAKGVDFVGEAGAGR